MFMLVSRRYERASLIVTSNKPFSAWGEIFGDDVTAAAMIDRLVHHAEILALKGDSYRLKDRDLARPTPTPRTDARGERRSGSPYGLASATPAAHPKGGHFSTGARGSLSSGLDSRGRFPGFEFGLRSAGTTKIACWQAVLEWRDPDSNRRHHDFQTGRRTLLSRNSPC